MTLWHIMHPASRLPHLIRAFLSKAGKVSGAPVIVHSRVRPDDLIANRDEGPEWLAENYSLPLDTVKAVLVFYDQMSRAPHPV